MQGTRRGPRAGGRGGAEPGATTIGAWRRLARSSPLRSPAARAAPSSRPITSRPRPASGSCGPAAARWTRRSPRTPCSPSSSARPAGSAATPSGSSGTRPRPRRSRSTAPGGLRPSADAGRPAGPRPGDAPVPRAAHDHGARAPSARGATPTPASGGCRGRTSSRPAIELAGGGFPADEHFVAGGRGLGARSSTASWAPAPAAGPRPTVPTAVPGGPGERVRLPALAATLERLAAAGADDFYAGELAGRQAAGLAAAGQRDHGRRPGRPRLDLGDAARARLPRARRPPPTRRTARAWSASRSSTSCGRWSRPTPRPSSRATAARRPAPTCAGPTSGSRPRSGPSPIATRTCPIRRSSTCRSSGCWTRRTARPWPAAIDPARASAPPPSRAPARRRHDLARGRGPAGQRGQPHRVELRRLRERRRGPGDGDRLPEPRAATSAWTRTTRTCWRRASGRCTRCSPGCSSGTGGPWVVHGSMGGDAQPAIFAQVVSALVDGGVDVATAVAAPRWSPVPPAHFAPPDVVQIEPRFRPGLLDGLAAMGHRLDVRDAVRRRRSATPTRSSSSRAGPRAGGTLAAATDPRSPGPGGRVVSGRHRAGRDR